jgi:hypothetical protein
LKGDSPTVGSVRLIVDTDNVAWMFHRKTNSRLTLRPQERCEGWNPIFVAGVSTVTYWGGEKASLPDGWTDSPERLSLIFACEEAQCKSSGTQCQVMTCGGVQGGTDACVHTDKIPLFGAQEPTPAADDKLDNRA